MAAYQDKAKERIRRGLRKFTVIARDARKNSINEADTRLIITAMLNDLLGWDMFEDITTEQCIKGQYCDYAIKRPGGLLAIVEAKSAGTALSPKHLYQAVSYAANEAVDWVILTNGADWQVYRVVFGKPVSQDLVFEVSLLDEETKPAAKAELFYLISCEAQRGGDLEAYAKKKSALCGANIAKALLREKMLERLRLEMRALHGHNASLQELATLLVEEVFRPDVQDDETTRLIRKAAAAGGSSRRKRVTGRAAVAKATATDCGSQDQADEPVEDYEQLVIDVLRSSEQPLGRGDIVAATKMPESLWTVTIRRLLERGAIVQEGSKRGAKYQVPVLERASID